MRPPATGLRDQLQRSLQIGNRAASPRQLFEHVPRLRQAALDPGAQLGHRERRRALGRARRQHHLDAAVGVHVDPHPARARRAADGVGDLLHRVLSVRVPAGDSTRHGIQIDPETGIQIGSETGAAPAAHGRVPGARRSYSARSHGRASFNAPRIARVAGERLSV